MAKEKIKILSALLVLVMLVVLFHERDDKRYSDMECYEDYKEIEKMENVGEREEILSRGFYLDSDGVIHESKDYKEVVQEVMDNKKGRR